MGPVSRRKKRSLARTAAGIVLVLGTLIFAGAVVHFSYTAYESSQCYTEIADDSLSQKSRRLQVVDSDDCRRILASSEQHQRIDAALAILAIVVGIGAAVRLSNASHRTRRLVLMAEVVAVTVGTIYFILLETVLRSGIVR